MSHKNYRAALAELMQFDSMKSRTTGSFSKYTLNIVGQGFVFIETVSLETASVKVFMDFISKLDLPNITWEADYVTSGDNLTLTVHLEQIKGLSNYMPVLGKGWKNELAIKTNYGYVAIPEGLKVVKHLNTNSAACNVRLDTAKSRLEGFFGKTQVKARVSHGLGGYAFVNGSVTAELTGEELLVSVSNFSKDGKTGDLKPIAKMYPSSMEFKDLIFANDVDASATGGIKAFLLMDSDYRWMVIGQQV